jgi:hypothetical protein
MGRCFSFGWSAGFQRTMLTAEFRPAILKEVGSTHKKVLNTHITPAPIPTPQSSPKPYPYWLATCWCQGMRPMVWQALQEASKSRWICYMSLILLGYFIWACCIGEGSISRPFRIWDLFKAGRSRGFENLLIDLSFM